MDGSTRHVISDNHIPALQSCTVYGPIPSIACLGPEAPQQVLSCRASSPDCKLERYIDTLVNGWPTPQIKGGSRSLDTRAPGSTLANNLLALCPWQVAAARAGWSWSCLPGPYVMPMSSRSPRRHGLALLAVIVTQTLALQRGISHGLSLCRFFVGLLSTSGHVHL